MSGKGHIYFLGIGGIGMSAIARYFHSRGESVCGYDRTPTELTEELIKEGIPVVFADDVSSIPEHVDRVIWTPAIPKYNHIYRYFLENGHKMQKRSAVLGEITSSHRNAAVAGTHGKTTTGTLLSHLLAYGRFPFTSFLGGISVNYSTNFIQLGDQWMVEEADEYDQSFLQLNPDLAVITSADADHLDIYGDRNAMVSGYVGFSRKIRKGGLLLTGPRISQDDFESFRSAVQEGVRLLSYGAASSDVKGMVTGTEKGWVRFDYADDLGNLWEGLSMRLPGAHNVENAVAAIRLAVEMGLDENTIREALLCFKGIRRRFEWLHEGDQVLIDDYAHHPEELRAAISALRECYPGRKLLGIFQPHLYTRTRDFAGEFASVLDALDEVILVELYPAREEPVEGISSHTILDLMKNPNRSFVPQERLLEELRHREIGVVALLGAGDLSMMRDHIKKLLG